MEMVVLVDVEGEVVVVVVGAEKDGDVQVRKWRVTCAVVVEIHRMVLMLIGAMVGIRVRVLAGVRLHPSCLWLTSRRLETTKRGFWLEEGVLASD
jgi:hypothetical protein